MGCETATCSGNGFTRPEPGGRLVGDVHSQSSSIVSGHLSLSERNSESQCDPVDEVEIGDDQVRQQDVGLRDAVVAQSLEVIG